MNINCLLFLLSFLYCLFPQVGFTRSPAVMPVRGISIDHLDIRPANEVKGPSFNPTPLKEISNTWGWKETTLSLVALFSLLLLVLRKKWSIIRENKAFLEQHQNILLHHNHPLSNNENSKEEPKKAA